jgi:hypothetical protein
MISSLNLLKLVKTGGGRLIIAMLSHILHCHIIFITNMTLLKLATLLIIIFSGSCIRIEKVVVTSDKGSITKYRAFLDHFRVNSYSLTAKSIIVYTSKIVHGVSTL